MTDPGNEGCGVEAMAPDPNLANFYPKLHKKIKLYPVYSSVRKRQLLQNVRFLLPANEVAGR